MRLAAGKENYEGWARSPGVLRPVPREGWLHISTGNPTLSTLRPPARTLHEPHVQLCVRIGLAAGSPLPAGERSARSVEPGEGG